MRIDRDGIDKFYDYGINTDTKTLYMADTEGDGEVNSTMAINVIKGLHILENIPNDKPINIILNSIGGDVYHGLAIFDAIQACKNHVVIKVYGQAVSMGAIILQAGDERLLAPNARLMVHYGTLSLDDTVKNVYRWADDAKRLDRLFEDILLDKIKEKHVKYTQARVKSLLQFDTILNSSEAIELGLADGLIK